MKFLGDCITYDFTVAKIDGGEIANSSSNEFHIEFRYRKSNASEIETEVRRSLQIPRASQQLEPIMSDLLGDYEVEAAPKSAMSAHFKFQLERLNIFHRRVVTVAVNLHEETITPERAEALRRRMGEAGRRRRRTRREVDEEVGTMPASKEAVEALERVRVSDDGVDRECAICLERLEEGVEVIKLPCMHVFHTHCILPWFLQTHFCPFCRFNLPC